MNIVTQKDWTSGLNAATGKLTVNPNTVIRNSNLLYTKRGSLVARDGMIFIDFVELPTGTHYVAAVLGGSVDAFGLKTIGVNFAQDTSVISVVDIFGGFAGVGATIASDYLYPNAGNVNGRLSGYRLPQIVNFNNNIVMCWGNDAAPRQIATTASSLSVGYAIKPLTAIAGQTPPIGAAHGCYHLGVLWLWNTAPQTAGLDGPSTLRQSDASNKDANHWPNANSVTVDKDDGTQGQGMASFTIADAGISPTAQLILFKDFATYLVTGTFGAADFQIQKAQTDMGCIAPRTIQFVPGFGIVRMTHLGVALFDGLRDKIISEEIRPYIFGGEDDITPVDFGNVQYSVAFVTANPPMYCIAMPLLGKNFVAPTNLDVGQLDGPLTRIFCYDLVLKAWTIVDFQSSRTTGVQEPNGITCGGQIRIAGSQPINILGIQSPYSASIFGASYYQWQGGGMNFHTPVQWRFRTPEVIGRSPSQRMYFRRSVLRAKYPLTINPSAGDYGPATDVVNSTVRYGATQASATPSVKASGVQNQAIYGESRYGMANYGVGSLSDLVAVADMGATAFSANIEYNGTGPIEILSNDWHVTEKPAGAFERVS